MSGRHQQRRVRREARQNAAAYEPGSTWDYSNSTDVLGRVIEVVSGQTLSGLLKTRLLDPLGMKDTSFYVPEPERQARIAEPFANDRSWVVPAERTGGSTPATTCSSSS